MAGTAANDGIVIWDVGRVSTSFNVPASSRTTLAILVMATRRRENVLALASKGSMWVPSVAVSGSPFRIPNPETSCQRNA